MHMKNSPGRFIWQCTSLVSAALLLFCGLRSIQAAQVSIQKSAGEVTVSWPVELGLVQPQKTGDLASTAWQDLGVPTSTGATTDLLATVSAFYRLRFLEPGIVSQPIGRNLAIGGATTLSVNATGTAPISYQWWKDGVEISNQTDTSLTLENVEVGDSGAYSVVVSNSAGSVTSEAAQLVVTPTLVRPHGIYMGTFTGQTNGGFAMMVNSEGVAVILGYSPEQGQGLVSTNAQVSLDGSLSAPSILGGSIEGLFAGDAFNGTFTDTNDLTGTFSGVLMETTGVQESSLGFYEGAFTGLLAGHASLMLAADGTVFVYTFSDVVGAGGTFALIDESNTVSFTTDFTLPGTTIPGILSIDGALDPVTHVFAGGFGFGGLTLGTISISRVSTP